MVLAEVRCSYQLEMSVAVQPAVSKYAQELPKEAKQRYLQKLQLVGDIDPFCLNTTKYKESSHLPPFSSGDLVSYLVLQTNYLSAKQFRAHKSLEAYNQSTSGWVKEVHTWNIKEKYVVTGRVSLHRWLIY